MRVFVTGGTGTIGTPVVAELLANGHSVLALARSDNSARTIEEVGAEPLRGELADLDVLRAGAARADGVINIAFGRDYSSPEAIADSIAEESTALDTLGRELIGSNRPIVTVSGTPLSPGRAATEADPLVTDGPMGGRGVSVNALLALASEGVRSSAVRLPRTVHNNGEGGFAGTLTEVARRTGISGYPGDGSQRWPAVHALDAARLLRIALESAPGGSSWHAVGDEGDSVRDIATVIGRRLGLPVESVSVESFGPLGPVFAMDQPASSLYTRETLGWNPVHASLVVDLEHLRS